MNKKRGTITVAAVLLGVIGTILKNIEWNTALNKGEGLAVEFAPVSLALIALSVAVLIGAYVIASRLGKKEYPSKLNKGKGARRLQIFGGILIIIASVYFCLGYVQMGLTLVAMIFALGILAGVGLIALNSKKEDASAKRLWSIVIPVFCCAWTLVEYKVYSTEPQIIKYAYICLANAFVTLSFYFISGYYYDRKEPKWAVFSLFASIYFSIVVTFNTEAVFVSLMKAGFLFAIGAELPGLLNSIGEAEEVPIEESSEAVADALSAEESSEAVEEETEAATEDIPENTDEDTSHEE